MSDKSEAKATAALLNFIQGHSLEFANEFMKWLRKNGYEIRKIGKHDAGINR